MHKLISVAVLSAMSFLATASGGSPFNLTTGVTDISHRVYDLHMTILYICIAIGVVVFGVMFYAIIKHRKSKGATAAQFHESTKVEIIWTIIPFVILVTMAIPATSTLIEMEDNSQSDITIKITASQWKWHYQYFEHDFGFFSLLSTPSEQISNQAQKSENYLLEVDKPLVIPTGKKVRFLITADDVIHSWWVPAFAVKQDANPGFINEAWTRVNEPGIYRGQCAELCGKNHGFMPIVVKVLPQNEYDAWLKEQLAQVEVAKQAETKALASTLTYEESMTLGKQVYLARCAMCHQPNGQGIPGAFPPIKNSPMALNDKQAHIDIVLHGKAGTAMQAFSNQLTAKEIATVITYERNAWGNDTKDVIQVSEIINREVK
ncbi:cytochrome c oxidase subunit II [Psychrobium sp. 1_MG-2023]|uniref:cytochrome c oxidase subunit II n=1 Tax=Psychrobium sp. 1_MG-2023 TaxID=3062624 RepID=UPI002685A1E5